MGCVRVRFEGQAVFEAPVEVALFLVAEDAFCEAGEVVSAPRKKGGYSGEVHYVCAQI